MGCHAHMYEITDGSVFNLREEQEKFLKVVDDIEWPKKWAYLYKEYPFFLDREIIRYPDGSEELHYEAWFDCDMSLDNQPDYDIYALDARYEPELLLFKDKAFKIPCAEIIPDEFGHEKFVKTEPLFLAFKEVPCPSIRIYPYEKVFVTCDSFLEHLHNKSVVEADARKKEYSSWALTQEDYEWYAKFFKENFQYGKHMIRLG